MPRNLFRNFGNSCRLLVYSVAPKDICDTVGICIRNAKKAEYNLSGFNIGRIFKSLFLLLYIKNNDQYKYLGV